MLGAVRLNREALSLGCGDKTPQKANQRRETGLTGSNALGRAVGLRLGRRWELVNTTGDWAGWQCGRANDGGNWAFVTMLVGRGPAANETAIGPGAAAEPTTAAAASAGLASRADSTASNGCGRAWVEPPSGGRRLQMGFAE